MRNGEHLRTEMLIGKEGLDKLKVAHVAVFGLGGVGSYAAESLARSGIGALTLVDGDVIAPSNLNRQLYALRSTIGLNKADVARRRINDINPDIEVKAYKTFFLPENSGDFDFAEFDYVIDAVDTVSAKLEIIERCKAAGTPVISSMGTGNKLDPSKLEVVDIRDTKICPLAKVMRRELKKRGIEDVKAVCSEETPIKPKIEEFSETGRQSPGSMSFVPAAAGLMMAGEAVKHIIEK